MILVVDYNIKNVKIWGFGKGRGKGFLPCAVKDADEVNNDMVLKKWIRGVTGRHNLEAIYFRVLFGGDYFKRPVPVNDKFFERFMRLTDFFPFYVPSACAVMKRFRDIYGHTPIIAFFETSFFLKLPDTEKYYAMPFEYYQDDNIKKWGFHGIFHEASAYLVPAKSKNISMVFDKQTTVCSIYNRKPFSISLGYTPLEGIMSRTSCGDMDPGIVFYLMNIRNYSMYAIDELLKNKSGFVGLTGYDIDLGDMIKLYGRDSKIDLAFEVYCNQIIKHIGDGISVMGGLDNVVIAGKNIDILTPIIHKVLKKISFLGINLISLPWDKKMKTARITSETSTINVYLNRAGLSDIICQAACGYFSR